MMVQQKAHWRARDGSTGVWASDGTVRLRAGPTGPYRMIGRADSPERAHRRLRRAHRVRWERCWMYGTASDRRGTSLRSLMRQITDQPLPRRQLSEAAGWARVAALHLRVRQLTPDLGERTSPRGSIFDLPLTVGEALEAILSPDAPLSASERQAALAEMMGAATAPAEALLDDDDN